MPGNNAHDELFKAAFSITSEVEVFLQYYLPYIGQHLDLKSLKQEQTSYISENLKEFFSDIVYTCDWKSANDKQLTDHRIQVAFLLEHKSYLPDNIYIQLLRYLTETYQYQYQNKQALRLTIPVVVYHGADKWRMRAFEDYFELPDQLLIKYLPSFNYELIDLQSMAKEMILKQEIAYLLRSTFLLFKHKNDKRFLEEFSEEIFIFVERRELEQDRKLFFLKQLVFYLFNNFSFQPEEFMEFTKKLPAMTQTIANSLYENLLQEGMEKGMERGKILEIQKLVQLLARMQDNQIPQSLIHQLTAIPELFILQFCQHFSAPRIQQLTLQLQDAHEAMDVNDMQRILHKALLEYGFTETAIEALLAAQSSSRIS